MIDQIIENLYLSNKHDVLDECRNEQLKNLKISHILTITVECIPLEKQIPGISYKFFFALDMLTQDMFADDLLANALMYIRTSIENKGQVLVHCEAGISRSVFVVAAYLMQKFQWSTAKAVQHIQKIRPLAQPNISFMQQLEIFESCHFIADFQVVSQCSLYKNWLSNFSSADGSGNSCWLKVESYARFSENEKSPQWISSMNIDYRCRKCRKILFNDQHILRHKILISDIVANDKATEAANCSFGYFISPMEWMSLEEYRGKISCSCNEKLGSYDWGGRVCEGMIGKPCGRAVRPWIYVNQNKIDRIVKNDENFLSPISSSIISRPPILLDT